MPGRDFAHAREIILNLYNLRMLDATFSFVAARLQTNINIESQQKQLTLQVWYDVSLAKRVLMPFAGRNFLSLYTSSAPVKTPV